MGGAKRGSAVLMGGVVRWVFRTGADLVRWRDATARLFVVVAVVIVGSVVVVGKLGPVMVVVWSWGVVVVVL